MRELENEEFQEFCTRYGDDIATAMLEDICCHHTGPGWPFSVHISNRESHDREGNNETLSGHVYFRAKCFDFVIENGNWNGTVVKAWDRSSKYAWREPPPQSHWLFSPVSAVIVKIIVDGMRPMLLSMTEKLLSKKAI